ALESVSNNDQQIVKSLSDVINEINKIRQQKGEAALDPELLEIEKRLLAKIEAIKQAKGVEKSEVNQEIQSIDVQLERINADIDIIEDALKNNPPDIQNILNALNDLKAKKAELESQKSSSID